MKLLPLLAALVGAQTINSVRTPLQLSGGVLSHGSADGQIHVPKSYGVASGDCLLTNGFSGDAYWGACPGASGGLDSAHVESLIHDTAGPLRAYTLARIHDTAMVLRATPAALDTVNVRRIVHDTALILRTYATDRIHDTSLTLRTLISARMPGWSTANVIPKGDGISGLTASSLSDDGSTVTTAQPIRSTSATLSTGSVIGGLAGIGTWYSNSSVAWFGCSGNNAAGSFASGFYNGSAGGATVDGAQGSGVRISLGGVQSIGVGRNFIRSKDTLAFTSLEGAGSPGRLVIARNGNVTVDSSAITPASIGAAPAFTSSYGNQFWATPDGVGGVPSLRVIVPADIPTLNQSTTGTSAGVAGTVLANRVYASPNGTSGSLSPRLLVVADVPTLNQNTTGSAATLTTARTLTIGSTGHTFDGSADRTWTLAEIGAQPAGAYQPALTGGAANTGAKWTGASTLGNASWTDDGTTFQVNQMKFRPYVSDASFGAIYASGVTPGSTNFNLAMKNDGSILSLLASTRLELSSPSISVGFLKNGAPGVGVYSGGVSVSDLPASIQTVQNQPATQIIVGNGASGVTSDSRITSQFGSITAAGVTSNGYAASSTSAGSGPSIQISDTYSGHPASYGWAQQLGAPGSLDFWGFASPTWSSTPVLSISQSGAITTSAGVSATSDIVTSGGNVSGRSVAEAVQSVAVSTTPAVNLSNGNVVVIGASGVPGALTAATNITFTNPVVGSVTKLFIKQGTTSFAVTFTKTSANFYRSGKTASIASGSVVLLAADMTLSCFYEIDITWVTANIAMVSLIKT